MKESDNGTTVDCIHETIIDSDGAAWTLVDGDGLEVRKDSFPAGHSANVELLLYFDKKIYQSNDVGGWWVWNGSGWSDSSDPRTGTGGGEAPVEPVEPVGPVADKSVVVDLNSQTGSYVSPMIYGLGSSGDMASSKFETTNDSNWQAQARSLNMPLYRPNFGNSGLMKMIFDQQWADWSYIDTLLDNLPKFVDLDTCRILVTIGGHGPPPWCDIWQEWGQDAYADCCVQVAQRFESKGIHCDYWEMWNEPDGDGFDIDVYVALFRKFEKKMRDYASSIGRTYHLGGVTDTWMQGDRIRKLCENCNPDFVSYHQYVTGPGDGSYGPGNLSDTATVMQKGLHDFYRIVSDCRAATDGTSASDKPIFLGEWNIVFTPDSGGGNYNIDERQVTNIGAVFSALATTGIVDANKNCEMGAMWELYADTYYGVVRLDLSMSSQGVLFKKLAADMGGQQVRTTVDDSMNIKALATVNGDKYCVMLMNYDEWNGYDVNVSGLTGNEVSYFEISGSHMGGDSRSMSVASLGNLNVPPMSVVILNN